MRLPDHLSRDLRAALNALERSASLGSLRTRIARAERPPAAASLRAEASARAKSEGGTEKREALAAGPQRTD
jgi:hypothetical protein